MTSPEFENSQEQSRQSADVLDRPIAVTVVPCPPEEQGPLGRERLEHLATQVGAAAGKAVNTVRESANKVYHQMRSSTRTGYSQTSHSAQDLMTATRRNAKVAREEYPLHSLAVLAGIGFLIGIALRIWRSHEPRNA